MVVRINGITYFGIILFSTKRHLSFLQQIILYYIEQNLSIKVCIAHVLPFSMDSDIRNTAQMGLLSLIQRNNMDDIDLG